MFEVVIAFLGYPIGILLAYLCKEELVKGEKYFKNLSLILIFIIISLSFIIAEKSYLFIILGVIIGYLINKEYLFLALLKSNFYTNLLVFMYGIPYGTLKYKKEKAIIIDAFLFFVPIIILYYFPIDLNSISTGGLTGILLRKGLNLFSKQ